MNGKNYDNVSNTKPEEKKSTILFEELEPLTGNPNVGDLLAFKMLTMSSDGHTMEASPFNVGSALHVNKDTRMVDILLQDTLHRQRNAKTDYNREEHPSHIISLKINWSTVLEPKLIQRAQTKIS
ncbi:unnamed protein product [Medioppia subpectinata]|uniref:Coilin tudor domain-containing protein n=1 Tax=Medioppia subpectinata TaxID=1979941 RepID=A0A7R9LUY4_9ACAR|nr:unnamed protein product [Medioppia subpectinata]CAG2121657.1 unnamed protein product [Medioppia subpectinata]